jgi:nitroreductase
MFWSTTGIERKALSSELLFQYHKLEKGLVMPGVRRLFGIEPAVRVIELLQRWRNIDHGESNPVFLGAIETLRAYLERLEEDNLDPKGIITPRVSKFLHSFERRDESLITPQLLPQELEVEHSFNTFSRLTQLRRSVRDFQSKLVEREKLEAAVRLAQLSPSACNRQPCSVYLVDNPEKRQELLSYQNGNQGFGHSAPLVAIITSDQRCFHNASERHQPYIDGGLFTMSFILALSSQGLASCCLNWCVAPKVDLAVHHKFDIPLPQRIMMLIAIGYPSEGCMVPRSPKRELSEILIDL